MDGDLSDDINLCLADQDWNDDDIHKHFTESGSKVSLKCIELMRRNFEKTYKEITLRQREEISSKHLRKKSAQEISNENDIPIHFVEKVIKSFTFNLSEPCQGSEVYREAT